MSFPRGTNGNFLQQKVNQISFQRAVNITPQITLSTSERMYMCLHTHYDDQNYTINKLLIVSLKTASMTHFCVIIHYRLLSLIKVANTKVHFYPTNIRH